MNLNKKIVLGVIFVLQTIVIIILVINVCNKKIPTLTCPTEYRYYCSKGKNERESFTQEYYEEYVVNKEGLIISRTLADKYIFSSKENYDMQKNNFKPMENYEIVKDDKKMEISIYKNENMESLELWYRLIEQNLEKLDYVCEEIVSN